MFIKKAIKEIRYRYFEKLVKKTKHFFKKDIPIISVFYKKIKKITYIGNKYYCPCCKGSFRIFFPFGISELRKSAMCPGCGSLERHRLMYIYLKEKTNFFSNYLNVLHISPTQVLQNIFKKLPNINYISIDLDSPHVMYNMDITDLKFKNNLFDVIICYHVLEHVMNDYLALKEIFRILKPNGWAIIQVPIDYTLQYTFENPKIKSPKDRKKYFGHTEHVRIYGQDYLKRVESVGFKGKVDNYINLLPNHIRKQLGLSSGEKIYYFTKEN